ncbi:glycerate kinase type-2 family protein [Halovulum sp. GXIMD14793]
MKPDLLLRRLFDSAVAAAMPEHIVPGALPRPVSGRNVVVGGGKASAAMAAALEGVWPAEAGLEGLVITRYGHSVPCQRIKIAEAAHPVPDAAGATAAAQILRLVSDLGPDDQVIALISGGGSALLTLPPAGVLLEDLASMNRSLLASGATISEMNCLRRHLGQLSGGRMAAAAYPATLTALLISDVPGDDPADIASGPTIGDPTTLADARDVALKYKLALTQRIMAALQDGGNESIKPRDAWLARATTRIVAKPQSSLEAAAKTAKSAGGNAQILGDALEGEAQMLGQAHADLALTHQRKLPAASAPLVLLSGGVTTVTLPKNCSGRGGRNVDYLLGLAKGLNGAPGIYALAADTDGVDGIEEIAGAVIGPDTIVRAGVQALDAALTNHDGHSFFGALGSQLITGPTLTNVNDFRAILILPSGEGQQ